MDEDRFWEIIAATGGRADAAARAGFRRRLLGLPGPEVEAFTALLVQKVYALDTAAHYHQPVFSEAGPDADDEPDEVDPDLFVSLRLSVVLAGPQVYGEVLADPTALSRHAWPSLWEAESLVECIDQVFAERDLGTGSFPDRLLMETGSNPLGFDDVDPAVAVGPGVEVPAGGPGTEVAWLSLSCLPDSRAFARALPTAQARLRFTLLLDSVVEEFEAAAHRRAFFADRGFSAVHLDLELTDPGRAPITRVHREQGQLFVDLGRPAGPFRTSRGSLEDAEITAWARQLVADGLDQTAQRLVRADSSG